MTDFFVIVFVLVIIPIALYIIFKPMFRQNKLLNGIVNYDTFMRKFVFRIEITKEEFYSRLKIRNINGVLEYSLNEDCSVITFTMYNMKYSYKIIVDDFNESIILRVEQIQITSKPAFRINEFFIKKFNPKITKKHRLQLQPVLFIINLFFQTIPHTYRLINLH